MQIPRGAILEMAYFRYLYFQEDGRVLYALTTQPPHEAFRRFRKYLLHREADSSMEIVLGNYAVQKQSVTVTAKQSWQYVKLELSIQDDSHHGRWGLLSFDRHLTSTKGGFDWGDCLEFEIPDAEPFRFVRDRFL